MGNLIGKLGVSVSVKFKKLNFATANGMNKSAAGPVRKLRKIFGGKGAGELIKGAATAFFLRVLGLLLSYFFAFLVAKKLGAEAWGNFSVYFTLLSVLTLIGRLGLETYLLKVFAAEPECTIKNRCRYFKSLLLILASSAVLGLFAAAAAGLLTHYFRIDPTTVLLLSVSVFPATLAFLNAEVLRAFKRVAEYLLANSILPYLFAILTFELLLLWNLKQVNLPVISFSLGLFLSAIFSLLALRKVGLIGKPADLDCELKIPFPFLVVNLLLFATGNLDLLILSIFRPLNEVGAYNIAVRLTNAVNFILFAVNTIAAAQFSRFYKEKDLVNLKAAVKNSTRLAVAASLPLLLILILFPEKVLGIFGSEFLAASQALVILTLGQLVNVISGSVGYFLMMTDQEKNYLKIMGLTLFANLLLGLLLIPTMGIPGAAITKAVSLSLWNLAAVLYVKRKFGFYTFPL